MTESIPTLSATKIKVFKTCSRQYFYKYLQDEKLPEKKNTAALLGTALHKAIELKYREDANPTLVFQETMINTLEDWQKYGDLLVGEQYWTNYLKEGKRILREMDWTKLSPLKINDEYALEHSFTLPFPNADNPICNITGIIDFIGEDAFDYVIVDHKSSKKALAEEELSNDPQFILYYWAGIQLMGYPPSHVYWHHLRTGELIEANISENYNDKLMQLCDDIQAMLTNEYHPRKNIDSFCRTLCSFKQLCFPSGDVIDTSELTEE